MLQAKEVEVAVTKAAADARKHVRGALAKGQSFPHRGGRRGRGAVVMLRPAGPGTVIAGGACRRARLAGYKNCFAKQLGSSNRSTTRGRSCRASARCAPTSRWRRRGT